MVPIRPCCDAHPFVTQCDVLSRHDCTRTHHSSSTSAIGIEIEAKGIACSWTPVGRRQLQSLLSRENQSRGALAHSAQGFTAFTHPPSTRPHTHTRQNRRLPSIRDGVGLHSPTVFEVLILDGRTAPAICVRLISDGSGRTMHKAVESMTSFCGLPLSHFSSSRGHSVSSDNKACFFLLASVCARIQT